MKRKGKKERERELYILKMYVFSSMDFLRNVKSILNFS